MDCIVHGCKELDTTEQLSLFQISPIPAPTVSSRKAGAWSSAFTTILLPLRPMPEVIQLANWPQFRVQKSRSPWPGAVLCIEKAPTNICGMSVFQTPRWDEDTGQRAPQSQCSVYLAACGQTNGLSYLGG